MKSILLYAIIGISLLASITAIAPVSHALTTKTFVLDSGSTITSCGASDDVMNQDPSSAPTASTGVAYAYGFCSAAGYQGTDTFSVSAATITLYLEVTTNGPAASGVVSGNMLDVSDGNAQVYSFSLTPFTAGATCTANTITVTRPFGQLIPGDNLLANFNFYAAGGTPQVNPTLCTGGSSLSSVSEIQIQGSSSIPAPEFPLGTVLSVLAPFGAIAAYLVLTAKFRKVPSTKI